MRGIYADLEAKFCKIKGVFLAFILKYMSVNETSWLRFKIRRYGRRGHPSRSKNGAEGCQRLSAEEIVTLTVFARDAPKDPTQRSYSKLMSSNVDRISAVSPSGCRCRSPDDRGRHHGWLLVVTGGALPAALLAMSIYGAFDWHRGGDGRYPRMS